MSRYEEEQVVARVDGRLMAVLSGGAVGSAPGPRVCPRWIVHFEVEAAARAVGDTFPPPGTPAAEYVIRDPEGALFTVSEADGGSSGSGDRPRVLEAAASTVRP